MDKASIIDFIASGFKVEDNKPGTGMNCKVITNHLNVYKAKYFHDMGFEIDADIPLGESVIAWKYIKQKQF